MKRIIIMATLLLSAVLNGEAGAVPEYEDISKPGRGMDFDTANNDCTQKTGDRYGETRAHKKCMLSHGWRSEKCPGLVTEDAYNNFRGCRPD
jgi:hypothetical protein